MRVFGCVLDVKTVIHSRSLLSFGNSVPNPDGGSCFATPLTRGVGQCPRACAGTSRVEEQLHGVLRRWRVVSKTAPLLVCAEIAWRLTRALAYQTLNLDTLMTQ